MHEIACAEKILKRALKRAACTEGKAQTLLGSKPDANACQCVPTKTCC